jgi:hypothetical protein
MRNMEEPALQKRFKDFIAGFSEITTSEDISKRVDTAFNVALGKLLETHGNMETVLQTGEAFGRGLFAEFISEEPNEWTMKKWLDTVMESIFAPIDTSFTHAEIESDKARSLMTHCSLQENSDETHAASLFTYGFIRGLLLSAFPKGELLMGSNMALGAPLTEFTFKTATSHMDRFERQRVKNLFTISKKL